MRCSLSLWTADRPPDIALVDPHVDQLVGWTITSAPDAGPHKTTAPTASSAAALAINVDLPQLCQNVCLSGSADAVLPRRSSSTHDALGAGLVVFSVFVHAPAGGDAEDGEGLRGMSGLSGSASDRDSGLAALPYRCWATCLTEAHSGGAGAGA